MQGIPTRRWLPWLAVAATLLYLVSPSLTQPGDQNAKRKDVQKGPLKSSYDQVTKVLLGEETYQAMMEKDKADKASVVERQRKLLEERYNLTPKVDKQVTMTRGKPIAVGPAAKLPEDMTWDKLATFSPEEIRQKNLFPKGYLPLPHPRAHERAFVLAPWHDADPGAELPGRGAVAQLLKEVGAEGVHRRTDIALQLPE